MSDVLHPYEAGKMLAVISDNNVIRFPEDTDHAASNEAEQNKSTEEQTEKQIQRLSFKLAW